MPKISDLPSTSAPTTADTLPIVQSGVTKKATLNDLPISSAAQTALTNHTSNTGNPHSVTKAQVGLGNVDNTSDVNKPISTATAAALASNISRLSAVAGTDTITGTASNLSAYTNLQLVTFIPAATNTGAAATLNINGLGAVSIVKNGSTALSAGDLVSGKGALVEYDGTQFQLINPATVGQVSLSTTGFLKVPGGFTIQWGQTTTSGSADVSITFPTAFSTNAYAATATITSSVTGYATTVNNLTTTGMSLGSWLNNSTRASALTCWIVIGK